jgi:hypothetical protein
MGYTFLEAHETSPKNLIISCILSDRNGIKLEINSNSNYRNYTNTQRSSSTFLNDDWVIEESKE